MERPWRRRASQVSGAVPAELVHAPIALQLARLDPRPPTGKAWLHKLKWDGYRMVATVASGRARLWSRNALDWTDRLPGLVRSLQRLPTNAALDGEVIAGGGRVQDFGALQQAIGKRGAPLTFVAFDLLHLAGYDLRAAPLAARKALLAELLADAASGLAVSTHIAGDGAEAFRLAAEAGFEGIVSKRADRPYVSGRGDDWRKVKVVATAEFAVVGFTPGAHGTFSSLLLAQPDARSGWRYAGRVGTGFDARTLRVIEALLDPGAETPPVAIAATEHAPKKARWFAPRFVIEAYVRGHGTSGVLRHASFKGLRPDKPVGALSAV